MQIIKLDCGESLLVDDEDYRLALRYDWEPREYKTSGKPQTFLRSSNARPFVYLHRLLGYGGLSKGSRRLYFKDANRFNYQRENLAVVTWHALKKTNKQAVKKTSYVRDEWWVNCKLKIFYVDRCGCTIRSTPNRQDNLLCSTCCSSYYPRYSACLDIASKLDWKGWEPVAGEWCEMLKVAIEKAKEAQKLFDTGN